MIKVIVRHPEKAALHPVAPEGWNGIHPDTPLKEVSISAQGIELVPVSGSKTTLPADPHQHFLILETRGETPIQQYDLTDRTVNGLGFSRRFPSADRHVVFVYTKEGQLS